MTKRIEITKENGKVTGILIDGKPVKKSFLNAFLKAQETSYFTLSKESYVIQNPFSRQTMQVNPLEHTIYTWCKKWERIYNVQGVKAAGASIQTFDNMRYFALELNPTLYSDFLD